MVNNFLWGEVATSRAAGWGRGRSWRWVCGVCLLPLDNLILLCFFTREQVCFYNLKHSRDFPGCPVVKTPRFHCRIPGWGNSDPACCKKSESESHSGVSNSLWPQGLNSPRNSPGQNIGVGSHSLLQGFFPILGSNPGLPHCRRILYQLSHKGSAWCTVRPKKQKHIYKEFIQLNTKKATW